MGALSDQLPFEPARDQGHGSLSDRSLVLEPPRRLDPHRPAPRKEGLVQTPVGWLRGGDFLGEPAGQLRLVVPEPGLQGAIQESGGGMIDQIVDSAGVSCLGRVGRDREEGVMSAEDDGLRIGVDEARAKVESGEAVALDVVQPGAWDQIDGAVKGAVRIPPADIEQRFRELPLDLDFITYCT